LQISRTINWLRRGPIGTAALCTFDASSGRCRTNCVVCDVQITPAIPGARPGLDAIYGIFR
jgi:hypothetical protein